MGKITYNDKVKINELTNVPAINKVQDVDMNEIKTSVNTIYDALGTGTDTYSTSTSYVAGDMVIYNGMIYECTTATSGAWNSANWSLVPVVENDMINNNLLPQVYDSGWIEITQNDLSQGTVSSGYYAPAYRKIGNIVYLKGQVTGITTRASAIFTLPSGYYNNSNRLSFCTTNDNLEVNFIRVLNTGVVQIQQTTGTLSSGVNAFFDGISFTVD